MIKKERRHEIDWLRVIAFYVLILYHAGMLFVPWGWHVKNPETSEWFETWMAFSSQFRLPLLFIISGIGVYYALGFRSGWTFIKERNRRLLIPLLFGMLVIVPPQIYFERISNGIEFAGYFDFYKTVFELIPYPAGGSFSWHHLWFLPYIFVYSLLCLPLFLFLRSERSKKLKEKMLRCFSRPGFIYLLGVPLLAIHYLLSWQFPTTHALINDWCNFTYSLVFFLFGFLFVSVPGLWDVIEQQRKVSFKISLVPLFVLVFFVWGPGLELFDEQAESFFFIYGFLKITFVTTWLLTIIGYSRRLFNKPGKLLSYASESVYPFYILHQTITITAGHYLASWQIGIVSKFIVVVIITFAGCFIIYELLIKRFNITRLLFGLKPLRKLKKIQNEPREEILAASKE